MACLCVVLRCFPLQESPVGRCYKQSPPGNWPIWTFLALRLQLAAVRVRMSRSLLKSLVLAPLYGRYSLMQPFWLQASNSCSFLRLSYAAIPRFSPLRPPWTRDLFPSAALRKRDLCTGFWLSWARPATPCSWAHSERVAPKLALTRSLPQLFVARSFELDLCSLQFSV